jgi:hypothetical protein
MDCMDSLDLMDVMDHMDMMSQRDGLPRCKRNFAGMSVLMNRFEHEHEGERVSVLPNRSPTHLRAIGGAAPRRRL